MHKTCHRYIEFSMLVYAIHVILISSFDISVMHASIVAPEIIYRLSLVARSMDCIAIISKLRKMFVARSIGDCAIDRMVRKR